MPLQLTNTERLECGLDALGTLDLPSIGSPFLGLVCAWSTGLELAVLAFENVPMGSRMAHIAMPHHQCGVGFNHLERMVAGTHAGHCHLQIAEIGVKLTSSSSCTTVFSRRGQFVSYRLLELT
jgi:hypothetical protein